MTWVVQSYRALTWLRPFDIVAFACEPPHAQEVRVPCQVLGTAVPLPAIVEVEQEVASVRLAAGSQRSPRVLHVTSAMRIPHWPLYPSFAVIYGNAFVGVAVRSSEYVQDVVASQTKQPPLLGNVTARKWSAALGYPPITCRPRGPGYLGGVFFCHDVVAPQHPLPVVRLIVDPDLGVREEDGFALFHKHGGVIQNGLRRLVART